MTDKDLFSEIILNTSLYVELSSAVNLLVELFLLCDDRLIMSVEKKNKTVRRPQHFFFTARRNLA